MILCDDAAGISSTLYCPVWDLNGQVFSALAVSIKPLHDVLRCINFKPQALVRISEDGLRISVEESRSLQAHAFLESNLFSSYKFSHDTEIVSFSISLAALMELLSIYNPVKEQTAFGQSTNILRMGGTLRLTYTEYGSSLDMILEENGVVTTCSLTTYEPDDLADIDLESDPVPNKLIMKSEWLSDAISELDGSGGDVLTIRQSPTRPFFRLSVKGLLGSAQMDYPNDRSVIETFQCRNDVKNSYKFSMIRTCLKAMAAAEKVSMRTDDVGTMAIQFMIDVGEGRYSFVEFKALALNEDDDGSQEDEEQDYAHAANETIDF